MVHKMHSSKYGALFSNVWHFFWFIASTTSKCKSIIKKKNLPQSWKWISDQHTMRFPRLFPLRKKCRCKNKLVSFLLSSFHLKCNPSVMCVLFVNLGYIGSLISSVKLNGLLSVRKKRKTLSVQKLRFWIHWPISVHL